MEEIKVFNTQAVDKLNVPEWLQATFEAKYDISKSTLTSIQIINMLQYVEPVFASNPHTAKNNTGVVIQSSRAFIGSDKSMKQYRIAPGEKVSVIGVRYIKPQRQLYTNSRDIASFDSQVACGEAAHFAKYDETIKSITSEVANDYDIAIDYINYVASWNARTLSIYKQDVSGSDFVPIADIKTKRDVAKASYVPVYDVSTAALAGLLNEYTDFALGNKLAFANAVERYETLQQMRETLVEADALALTSARRNHHALELFKKPYAECSAKEQTLIDKYQKFKTLDDPARVASAESIIAEADVEAARRFNTRDLCGHYDMYLSMLAKGDSTDKILNAIVHKIGEATDGNYYCKNCGKLLMTEISDDTLSYRQQNIISSEDNPLVNAVLMETTQIMRFIKFKKPQNTRGLINAIVGLVVSKIEAQQVELQKSKTQSIDTIRLLTMIYIDIYVFAILANIIINNNDVSFNIVVGGKIKPQNEAAKILSTAYTLIIDSNKSRLAKITGFSAENIKPVLLEAYRWAQDTKFEPETEEPEIVDNLNNNAIYNAVYQMQTHMFDDYKNVIGDSNPLKKLESDNPFDYVLKNLKGDDYPVVAFRNFLEYVETGMYKEFASPASEKLSAFFRESEKINNDKQVEINRVYQRLGPFGYMHVAPRVYKFEDVALAVIYCPDGRKHKFREGACVNCKSRPNVASKEMNDKVKDNIIRRRFFKYYEYRCPAGESHEYNKKQLIEVVACKKCGRTPGTETDAYYKKYGKMLARVAPINKMSYVPKTEIFKPDAVPKWTSSNAKIMQLANQSQIPYNVWINLGLSEGYVFDDIKSGKINPSTKTDDEVAKGRATKLKNYINYVRVQYNLVKNHSTAVLPVALKQLVEEYGVVDLKKNMINLFAEYDNKITAYELSETPTNVCNFVLNAIATALTQMRGLDKVKRTTSKLFDILCANLQKFEVQTSLVQAKKVVVAEVNTDEIEHTAVADVLDIDEEPADPFSFDDVDVETTNMGLEDEEYMD